MMSKNLIELSDSLLLEVQKNPQVYLYHFLLACLAIQKKFQKEWAGIIPLVISRWAFLMKKN